MKTATDLRTQTQAAIRARREAGERKVALLVEAAQEAANRGEFSLVAEKAFLSAHARDAAADALAQLGFWVVRRMADECLGIYGLEFSWAAGARE